MPVATYLHANLLERKPSHLFLLPCGEVLSLHQCGLQAPCWSWVSLQGKHLHQSIVFCTVIGGWIFLGHTVHLKREFVFAYVSGDWDEVLEGGAVTSATTTTYIPHIVQVVSWGMTNPALVVTINDGVVRDWADEGHGLRASSGQAPTPVAAPGTGSLGQ